MMRRKDGGAKCMNKPQSRPEKTKYWIRGLISIGENPPLGEAAHRSCCGIYSNHHHFPVVCLIGLVIAAGGQLPFFSHLRVGRDGREFGCLKFRSMRDDADQALKRLLLFKRAVKVEWEIRGS